MFGHANQDTIFLTSETTNNNNSHKARFIPWSDPDSYPRMAHRASSRYTNPSISRYRHRSKTETESHAATATILPHEVLCSTPPPCPVKHNVSQLPGSPFSRNRLLSCLSRPHWDRLRTRFEPLFNIVQNTPVTSPTALKTNPPSNVAQMLDSPPPCQCR